MLAFLKNCHKPWGFKMAYKQSRSDRMDESLGMRRGKESTKTQSYKSRRDESRGMKKSMKAESYGGKGFNLTDGMQSGIVKSINTNSEQYDLGRVQKYKCGSKGYPAEAWNYKY